MPSKPIPGLIHLGGNDYHLFDKNLQHLSIPTARLVGGMQKLVDFSTKFAESSIEWRHNYSTDYPRLAKMGAPFPNDVYSTETVTDIPSGWRVVYDPHEHDVPPGINPYYI